MAEFYRKGNAMKTFVNVKVKKSLLSFAMIIFLCGIVYAQESMVGEQNGITWKSLVIGTPAEALSRKTFYIDGLDNMSAFWSQHTDFPNGPIQENAGAIDFNKVFIGVSVGQIRDGLDSFYVDEKNLQIPIIDAILIIRLQNAHVSETTVDGVLKLFREATINGPDPAWDNKIWRTSLKFLK